MDCPVPAEVPHLDVPVHGASAEHGLVTVHGQALDCMVMCLEGVEQLGLPHVPDTDLAFLASRDEELVLAGVEESSGSSIVTAETRNTYNLHDISAPALLVMLHAGLPSRQQCVPESNIPAIMTVSCRGQEGGAASLEHKVSSIAAVGLLGEEGG